MATEELLNNCIAKEQFWQDHIKLKRESGLSRAAYCRKHELILSQFAYWELKWMPEQSKLLPVNLDISSKFLEISCTVTFKSGHELKVHDHAIIPLLISLLG